MYYPGGPPGEGYWQGYPEHPSPPSLPGGYYGQSPEYIRRAAEFTAKHSKLIGGILLFGGLATIWVLAMSKDPLLTTIASISALVGYGLLKSKPRLIEIPVT